MSVADLPHDRPTGSGLTPPEVRGRLTRLLTAELMAAWDAAVVAGAAPAELAAVVDKRCRAIQERLSDSAEKHAELATPKGENGAG